MIVKSILDEDFVNYRKPSMFIIFPYCSFKCDKENNCALCQNSHLAHEPNIDINVIDLLSRYKDNPITEAIVCGGLEPFDSLVDLLDLIGYARDWCGINDDIVIYTGYTEEELLENSDYQDIIQYPNIIVKFGRFRPNQKSHYDKILGVNLASDNQYAKKVSKYESI